MKLVGIMSLSEDRPKVRALLKNLGVQIYSETDILGHSTESLAKYGWFASPKETPEYASLCFAILPDENAESIVEAIANLQKQEPSDHPVRGFIVPVETMI